MNITPDMKKNTLIRSSSIIFLNLKPPISVKKITFCGNPTDPCHHHDYPEIWYCHKGHYIHETENGTYNCGPGSVVIIPPGVLHRLSNPKSNRLELTKIVSAFNLFEDLAPAVHINAISHMLLPRFSKELGFSLPEFTALSKESQAIAEKLMMKMSVKGFNSFFSLPEFELSAEQTEKALHVTKTRLHPILRALTYININYSKKITSEDLTKVSLLCRTNFFSTFKRYLGISYSTYLIMLRVLRANFAIAHTPYSLQYISDMCGFATNSYMSICYKKYKGHLPKLDRAQLKMFRQRYPDIHISHDYFENKE